MSLKKFSSEKKKFVKKFSSKNLVTLCLPQVVVLCFKYSWLFASCKSKKFIYW